MTKTKLTANLKGNMAFEMDINGHTVITDASEEIGGNDFGPRPKALLLAGLIGCTGIDIMSILKKMKVDLDDVIITAEAEQTTEDPKIYKGIHLVYTFKGKNLPMDKLERAVSLSQEIYCGVTAMLDKASPITYEIRVE